MIIAAIVTLKRGLEHFIYRELSYLESTGASIFLFPTKQGKGLYSARPTWQVNSWTWTRIAIAQLRSFLTGPRRYLSLLFEAIAYGAVSECLLAWHYSQRMEAADIIYSTFGDRKLFVGYFCKRILNKPLVVEIHAYELYSNPNAWLFRHALGWCDRIVAISEYNRVLLMDEYGVPPEKIEVIRCSLDLDEYRPTPKKYVVLIVGFFVERKGHEILFQAIKALERKDVEIWVVGDEGNESSEVTVDVRALAAKLGISDRVAFFGALGGAALKAMYRSCDVFCLPCHTDSAGNKEGFPCVLMEAMACGKPVITSRHVEIPRIVSEILVEELDVEGLAAVLDMALNSAPLRERMGRENRRLAEQHFSTANCLRTAAVLRDTVERYSGVPSDGSSRDCRSSAIKNQ